jgi:osmotically-inducible protein OsmY
MSFTAFARLDSGTDFQLLPAGSPLRVTGEDTAGGGAIYEDELVAAIRSALRATGYARLQNLEIELCRGVVVLSGEVPTYHQKQMAQVTVQRVDGIRGVANGVEVVCSRGNTSVGNGH